MTTSPVQISETLISKLAVGPKDVLCVRIKSDEISIEEVAELKTHLQTFFPDNKIMLMCIPAGSDVDITILTKEDNDGI